MAYKISKDSNAELQRAINLRRNGMTFDNAETALDFLVEHGRISNVEYWRKVLVTTRNVEYLIMKWADTLSAYIKCLEEIKLGNSEFIKAKESLEKKLLTCDREEVLYFIKEILPTYTLSLDELE